MSFCCFHCRSLQTALSVRAQNAIPRIRYRHYSQPGVTYRIRHRLLGHH